METHSNWQSCLDCKHFSGVVLEERTTLTAYGHTSKRKKYLYECKASKSGHIPFWVLSRNDLKILHDPCSLFDKKQKGTLNNG